MKQFGRKARVDIEDLSFSSDDLTINFDVPFDDDAEPNESKVEIYNLNANTINKLDKGKQLTLNAGYQDDAGVLLTGFASKVLTNIEVVDKITEITVLDGQKLDDKKTENRSFKKNIKAQQIMNALLPKLGLAVAVINLPENKTYSKGYTADGEITTTIQEVANDCGASFYIKKGQVYIRPLTEGDDLKFTLSPDTGLIGSPSPFEEEGDNGETISGYKVKCLLQYRISTASIINIKSESVSGQFRVKRGRHRWQDQQFITEMDVIHDE